MCLCMSVCWLTYSFSNAGRFQCKTLLVAQRRSYRTAIYAATTSAVFKGPCSVTMFVDGRSGVSACVPGDDEGGAYTGLSPPCTDPTWSLNAGRRGRNQVVDVRVNVQSQIVVFPSPSVHQHYSITKVQKPIACHSHIHLNTRTNTVLLIIYHSHYLNCSNMLLFSLLYILPVSECCI